jgi:hypothetical protein
MSHYNPFQKVNNESGAGGDRFETIILYSFDNNGRKHKLTHLIYWFMSLINFYNPFILVNNSILRQKHTYTEILSNSRVSKNACSVCLGCIRNITNFSYHIITEYTFYPYTRNRTTTCILYLSKNHILHTSILTQSFILIMYHTS